MEKSAQNARFYISTLMINTLFQIDFLMNDQIWNKIDNLATNYNTFLTLLTLLRINTLIT